MRAAACRFGNQVAHLAALVIAEDPLAVHYQYRQQQQQSQDEEAFLQPGQDVSLVEAAWAYDEEWWPEPWASPARLRCGLVLCLLLLPDASEAHCTQPTCGAAWTVPPVTIACTGGRLQWTQF